MKGFILCKLLVLGISYTTCLGFRFLGGSDDQKNQTNIRIHTLRIMNVPTECQLYGQLYKYWRLIGMLSEHDEANDA